MYQQREEEDLKLLQKFIPDATPEKLKAFQNCMRKDAVYKSAIPYGLVSAVATYMLIPKKIGTAKPVISVVTGLAAYMFGKLMYTPVCTEKAFGVKILSAKSSGRRSYSPATTEYTDDFDGQDHESKYSSHSDDTMEQEQVWNTFDADFESNANAFDDTSDPFQEEALNKEQKSGKRRVTYDDLWVQYRDQQSKEQYKDTNASRWKPVANERNRAFEDTVTSRVEAEVGERDIWS